MNEMKSVSLLNIKSFFWKFIILLLCLQIVDNLIIFLTINTLIPNPGIPQFRLICSISQVIVFIFFLISLKPSADELGIQWSDIRKAIRMIYFSGGLIICLLIVSSYFIMQPHGYFALITNFHFGLTTPIFEELIFRGYGWQNFRIEKRSIFLTLILTSLFFGIFHLGYYYQIAYATQFHPDAPSMAKIMVMKIIYATVLGLVMGFIRWKSRKVYGPIIIHSILNILGS